MSNQRFTRINTLELKASIVKKIGHQRADTYFNHLTRLFTSKITKLEFDKFCIKLIGRENIPLHNQLIKSIAKNACLSKTPPPKSIRLVKKVKIPNGYPRNTLQSLYGDSFPLSPKKGRSVINRDRKYTDRPSPLGPLGKPRSILCEQSEVVSVEYGEEVDQESTSLVGQSRTPLTAPFGFSVKSRKTHSDFSTHSRGTCVNNGILPGTRSLKTRLERKLEVEGVRVSMDCVNLLNNSLDIYLKRLIEPCIGLARSGNRSDHMRNFNCQFFSGSCIGSMLDFSAAMELNPRVLGEDWQIILEKISTRVFGE